MALLSICHSDLCTVDGFLSAVHFALPLLYSFYNTLPEATLRLFSPPFNILIRVPSPLLSKLDYYKRTLITSLTPILGTPVRIPECIKGRSLSAPSRLFAGASTLVSVDTKYDGERMQIHVNLKPQPCITIFSKSGRNSTCDRAGVHDSLLAALNLRSKSPAFSSSVILEAELVVYDFKQHKIAPFHRLSDHVPRGGIFIGAAQDKQAILHEQLVPVFFDVLAIDGRSLLKEPYTIRRQQLVALVQEIEGVSMIAKHTIVQASQVGDVFDEVVAAGCEGVVVKPCNGTYLGACMLEPFHRWIKLKKDYLAGQGDTAEFCVLGAGIDIQRAVAQKCKYDVS